MSNDPSRRKSRLIWLLATVAIIAVLSMVADRAKNAFLYRILTRTLAHAGMEASVGRLDSSFWSRTLVIEDLSLKNPTNYPVRDALDLKRLFVRYEGFPFFGGPVKFREIDLDIDRVVMVRQRDGKMNFEGLADAVKSERDVMAGEPEQKPGEQPAKPPVAGSAPAGTAGKKPANAGLPTADLVRLRLGAIEVHDFSLGESDPMVLKSQVGLDRSYTNVTDFAVLAADLQLALVAGQLPGDLGKSFMKASSSTNSAAMEEEMERKFEETIRGL